MTMQSIVSILINTVTMFSGMFVLGGASILYRQYKTRVLKLITIFLSSILLISLKFWSDSVFKQDYIVIEIMSFLGCILCIIVLPYLITSLISRKISTGVERVIWGWNILYVIEGIVFFIFPENALALPLVSIMLLVTIAIWILFLLINIKGLSNKLLKSSLSGFIILSFIFLLLLILDMLITTVPIESLSIIDNFSMAFYFVGINIGAFFFAGGFLNREAYMEKGKLTSSFLENFNLTSREGEIIEKVYQGKTNREIGEDLFISGKTVENHLRNIYQKMQIKSRMQLVTELNTWKRV